MTIQKVVMYKTTIPGKSHDYHHTVASAEAAHHAYMDSLLSPRLLACGFTRAEAVKVVGILVDDANLRRLLTKAMDWGLEDD